jgi:hypothetical protein
VLKRPLGWFTARAALLGVPPKISEAVPARLWGRLLDGEDRRFRACYDGRDSHAEADR